MHLTRSTRFGLVIIAAILGTVSAKEEGNAQYPPGEHRSSNVKVVAHVPLGPELSVSDIEIEQELERPYVYVSRMQYGVRGQIGFDIIDISNLALPVVVQRWRIENQDLHQGLGGMDGKYFKLDGRYYYVQSFQFRQGGPDNDLGAIVFDVTDLPDDIREVGRIRTPDTPGGFHNLFAYKHSDGRALLFATVEATEQDGHGANVYDMHEFLEGGEGHGLVARVPLPGPRGAGRGYHDAYVAYHAESGQDRFYGGGPETTYLGGNYVYDVSDLENPRLLATVRAVPGQQAGGHTFVATPDGRYALTMMTSLAHAPIRVFDLEPSLSGTQPIVTVPIGAWTPDWRKSVHNIEIRWPYAFISGYEDGLQILSIRDPRNPRQIGFYDTYNLPSEEYTVGEEANGAFGVDVRNADGLIVISDMKSGFWAFRLDGFDRWDGRDWGVENVSSVQDWDRERRVTRR